MAAKTFNPAGASANWSDTTAWGGSIPVSGDTCTITAGKTCIFDVDQSGMAAGLAGLLINGVLQCSTTAGAYVLKMDGTNGHNITFGANAQLLAGSVGTPLPANVTFTINLNGASAIFPNNVAGTALLLYAQQPGHMYCKLSAPAIIGDTVLAVDTNLTGDTPWGIASARVAVDNVNKTFDSEQRLISSISSTTITLTAGLTNAKVTGTYIHLMHRNIRITGGTNAAGSIQGALNSTFQCEVSGLASVGFSNCINTVMSGVCAGTGANLSTGHQNSFGGTVSGTLTGWAQCAVLDRGVTFSGVMSGSGSGPVQCNGCLFTSTCIITGTSTAVNQCADSAFAATITGNGSGLFYGSGLLLPAAVFSGNSSDIQLARGGLWVGYGISLASAAQVNAYTGLANLDPLGISQVVIWDYGAVTGACRAWMYGGHILDGVAQLPGDSRVAKSMNHVFESASAMTWLDYPVRLHVGVNSFLVFMRKDTNGMTVTPFAQLLTPGADPRFGGAALVTVPMTDNTNTWQSLIVSYTSTIEQNAILRVSGTNASGNLWHAMVQIPNGFSRSDSI